jgi:hypothetical protein
MPTRITGNFHARQAMHAIAARKPDSDGKQAPRIFAAFLNLPNSIYIIVAIALIFFALRAEPATIHAFFLSLD